MDSNKLNRNLIRVSAIATAVATNATIPVTLICIAVGLAIAEGVYIISEKIESTAK